MQALSQEKIQVRAYELWEQEGRPDGRAEEFWHRASSELSTNGAPKKASKPATARAPKAVSEPAAKPKKTGVKKPN